MKIYILCPAYMATGGTELLHQLHAKLIEKSMNSFIFYTDKQVDNSSDPTPPRFKKYLTKESEIILEIQDDEANYLVIPEISIGKITYQRIKLCYWWLSIDNFFIINNLSVQQYLKPNLKRIIKKIINWHPYHIINSMMKRPNFFCCFYQSTYAKLFLKKHFNPKILLPLEDFINSEVISDITLTKENVILYNPIKGFEITEQLINASSDRFKWKPLTNLPPKALGLLLASSKIYVDFGNHPGKDRIPREAAINHCVVISNTEGAAKNELDLPISKKYKFADPLKSKQQIFDLITDIFKNFDAHHQNFIHYRSAILNQEKEFDNQVENFIKLIS